MTLWLNSCIDSRILRYVIGFLVEIISEKIWILIIIVWIGLIVTFLNFCLEYLVICRSWEIYLTYLEVLRKLLDLSDKHFIYYTNRSEYSFPFFTREHCHLSAFLNCSLGKIRETLFVIVNLYQKCIYVIEVSINVTWETSVENFSNSEANERHWANLLYNRENVLPLLWEILSAVTWRRTLRKDCC